MKAKVIIGVPSGDSVARMFWASFGGAIWMEPKIGTTEIYSIAGMNVVSARNKIVAKALEEKFTHVFFMDSDMRFPKEALKNLLSHNLDIVGGFYVRKKDRFLPTAFKLGVRKGDSYLTCFPTKLEEVEGIGTGCLLIKTKVFKKIEPPWFEYRKSDQDGGKKGHMITEDLVFCEKAKELGYKIFCDGTIVCPHVGSFAVTPELHDGKPNVKVEPI